MQITHYFPAMIEENGGVVRAILDMVSALADAGQSVSLLTHDSLDCPPEWKEQSSRGSNPQVVQLGSLLPGSKRMRSGDLRTLSKHIEKSDVVHLHTPWAPSNQQVGGLCRRMGTPYILTLHGMLDDWCIEQKRWKKKFYLALGGRRLLENAAFVHCTAQEEQRQSRQHAPEAHWRVIPCLIDLQPYSVLPGPERAYEQFPQIATEGTSLLFLSRLHPKKGIERLLEAVSLLAESSPDFNVWIAGPGEEDYVGHLKKMARDLGLQDRSCFLGMVRDQLKLSLYQAADLFVLPTSQENFGLVSVEAMLCETPVLTTYGVDIWEDLQSGGATIVEGTSEAIAEAISTLVANTNLLKELGSQGRQHIHDWLAPDKVTRQLVNMYEEATGGVLASGISE